MTSIEALTRTESHIGVVGIGYVGTPLAVALHRHFSVFGFDTDGQRVRTLQGGVDRTRSVDNSRIREMSGCFTSDAAVLKQCSFIIITVPTPVSTDHTPDLEPLKCAARIVGRNLKGGSVVVVESTVYPGVTEEVVGPIIAHASGLEPGTGFHLGYSPERINPGDDTHTLEQLVKVVAGGSPQVTDLMTAVYGAVTGGKVYQAASIKTAEAAKVIENTQRDLNIALMNELAMICDRIGVDTGEVIRTASTKWNFARFEPGLVGGHCIGVDPYYLTYVAEKAGHLPQVILAGRQVNDLMGRYVAERAVSLIRTHNSGVNEARVLVLGLTFKENIPDVRNSRVADIIRVLKEYRVRCSMFDPEADPCEVRDCYGFSVLDDVTDDAPYDAVIVAVKHNIFRSLFPLEVLLSISVEDRPVLIDVRSMYERTAAQRLGFSYWRL